MFALKLGRRRASHAAAHKQPKEPDRSSLSVVDMDDPGTAKQADTKSVDSGSLEPAKPARQISLHQLMAMASALGYEVVDVSGFLDSLSVVSEAQLEAVGSALSASERVNAASASVAEIVEDVASTSNIAFEVATSSSEAVRASAARSAVVAQWVASAATQIEHVVKSLQEMEQNNDMVRDIASQINYLSINARIEATRAGEKGRQFSVIANAVNELSGQTNEVAEGVRQNISDLSDTVAQLAADSRAVRGEAEQVIQDNDATDAALTEIAEQVRLVNSHATNISAQSQEATQALSLFTPAFQQVGSSIKDTSKRIAGVTKRGHALIDQIEGIVQTCVSMGGETKDTPYIERVQNDARRMSAALEAALKSGQIREQDLFARKYSLIQGSNPAQFMTPFTALTDKLFTPIQEDALTLSDDVVFCAAVNVDGHLPTHNLKFSQKPGPDPDWNAGNCRNRRTFDDRVGLKAGNNSKPFLLQVYRRDMGGGVFKLMKDVSAPISVNGKHWGGLRLAYEA